MEVIVRPTEVIAAEQIKAEEKQRLLGVLPNFYTSYVYDAAPTHLETEIFVRHARDIRSGGDSRRGLRCRH